MMNRLVIEDNNGLYDLLGVPETYILAANPGDIILVKVPGNDKEQMAALGKQVKELLPNNQVLVLQDNIGVEVLPMSSEPTFSLMGTTK